jgi:hypothetical protein
MASWLGRPWPVTQDMETVRQKVNSLLSPMESSGKARTGPRLRHEKLTKPTKTKSPDKYWEVRGFVTCGPSAVGNAAKIQYLCHVRFKSFRDKFELLYQYRKSGCIDSRHPILRNDRISARAAVTFYFRDLWSVFQFSSVRLSHRAPGNLPTLRFANYMLWVSEIITQES